MVVSTVDTQLDVLVTLAEAEADSDPSDTELDIDDVDSAPLVDVVGLTVLDDDTAPFTATGFRSLAKISPTTAVIHCVVTAFDDAPVGVAEVVAYPP